MANLDYVLHEIFAEYDDQPTASTPQATYPAPSAAAAIATPAQGPQVTPASLHMNATTSSQNDISYYVVYSDSDLEILRRKRVRGTQEGAVLEHCSAITQAVFDCEHTCGYSISFSKRIEGGVCGAWA
jgi:hypothetical protein